MAALLLAPRLVFARLHYWRIGGQERAANILSEGEVSLPIATIQVIVEDAADAPWLAAMLKDKVFIAPGLESLVTTSVMAITSLPQLGMKIACRRLVGEHRRQVRAASKPRARGD